MLIILVIPMALVSICILVSEGSPVIFRQIRVGKEGRRFIIYKFRTMIRNADKLGPKSTSDNDTRITKIGQFLRRTSLDELPQLFNVIKGEMSFIGYRPDVVRDGDTYTEPKYKVKPGITGYAQVNGRSSLTIEELDYWENKYIEDIGFVADVKIFLKTIKSVLDKSGAN